MHHYDVILLKLSQATALLDGAIATVQANQGKGLSDDDASRIGQVRDLVDEQRVWFTVSFACRI